MTGRRTLLRTALLLGGGATIAACDRTQPLQQVEGQEFIGTGTLAQRANQIKRAGAGRGWQMQDVRPGLVRGTLALRDHFAVVDIPYDTQRFSIRLVEARNLLYDGQNIHRNFNSWVRNLTNDILAQPPV